jgi:hypothetical protein
MKRSVRLGLLMGLVLLAGLAFYVYRRPGAPAEGSAQGTAPGGPATPPESSGPAPVDLPPPVLAVDAAAGAGPGVATLKSSERTVKIKRAADLAWEDAKVDMALFESDALRTFPRSTATIAFGPDDLVEVDQNALVIIRPRRKESSEISLAVLSADLLEGLETRPAPERQKAIEAAAVKRQVTLSKMPAARAGGGKTRVAVKALPDRSTSVAVLAGTLRVTGPKGGDVTLTEKMATRISASGTLARPLPLPAAPFLAFPEDGAAYPFQSKAPRVELGWRPVERARTYRVVVTGDTAFRGVLSDERVSGTALTVRNLRPGTYYWRVRAQDKDGLEGPYSEARAIKAVFDDVPPRLEILTPAEMFVAPTASVELKGRTERGARVKINGRKVPVAPDGAFSYLMELREGVNLATLEVMDPAGNAQYGKRLITFRGAKRTSAASVSGDP